MELASLAKFKNNKFFLLMMKELLFGTAGIPLGAKGTTADGIRHVRKLGLGAFELEFVRSINISKEKAPLIRKARKAMLC